MHAVNGVSYTVNEREIVGIVGESGCGKSVSQLSVIQLIRRPGRIVGGEVWFEGREPPGVPTPTVPRCAPSAARRSA